MLTIDHHHIAYHTLNSSSSMIITSLVHRKVTPCTIGRDVDDDKEIVIMMIMIMKECSYVDMKSMSTTILGRCASIHLT